MTSIPSLSFHSPVRQMPDWAVLERQVLDTLSRAPDMLADYLMPDGSFFWPESVPDFQTFAYGKTDNAFESFQSFPLLYLLGGDDNLLAYSQQQYDAIVRLFSAKRKTMDVGIDPGEAARLGRDTMLVDECFPDYDWMHTAEGCMFLYHLLLANPAHRKTAERVLKLAQYHFGENPAGFDRNYDPEHRVFRTSCFGANGPAWDYFDRPIVHSHWMDSYDMALIDVPGVHTCLNLLDPEKAARYGKVYSERMKHCDTISNLLSTSLAACAFALTGDAQYRDFITDYVGAWRERADGYPVPADNAGPGGQVGETLGGRFYGAHFGWAHVGGIHFVGDSLIVGGENQRLVSGRADALDWARDTYNYLIDRFGVPRKDGGVLFPCKHRDPGSEINFLSSADIPYTVPSDRGPGVRRYVQNAEGWYGYTTPIPSHWGHIFAASKAHSDYARMKAILPPGQLLVARENLTGKDKGGQYGAYARYLAGAYPTYPEDILRYTLDVFHAQNAILEREKTGASASIGFAPDGEGEWEILRRITSELHEKYHLPFDASIVHSYYQTFLLYRQPLSVEGLMNLTMGAMLPIYNGGLIQAEARWFDMDRRRPGLCEGCAALIRTIDGDGFTVTLANTDARMHTLCLQGGAYGEHELLSVEGEGERLAPGAKWASVTLSPGTVITLRVKLRRWANAPSFKEPFGAYDRLEAF